MIPRSGCKLIYGLQGKRNLFKAAVSDRFIPEYVMLLKSLMTRMSEEDEGASERHHETGLDSYFLRIDLQLRIFRLQASLCSCKTQQLGSSICEESSSKQAETVSKVTADLLSVRLAG